MNESESLTSQPNIEQTLLAQSVREQDRASQLREEKQRTRQTESSSTDLTATDYESERDEPEPFTEAADQMTEPGEYLPPDASADNNTPATSNNNISGGNKTSAGSLPKIDGLTKNPLLAARILTCCTAPSCLGLFFSSGWWLLRWIFKKEKK